MYLITLFEKTLKSECRVVKKGRFPFYKDTVETVYSEDWVKVEQRVVKSKAMAEYLANLFKNSPLIKIEYKLIDNVSS